MRTKRRLKKKVKKALLIIILSSTLIFTTVSFTLAYLNKKDAKENEFILGKVSNIVNETFQNNVKENVSIQNNGNVSSYIRAYINISFKDENNTIISDIPIESTDYSLDLSSSPNWLYSSADGYYYYKLPVAPNESTDILLEECKQLTEYDDKVLNVDIISQSIQAQPTKAVEEAWNVTVVNNNITIGN